MPQFNCNHCGSLLSLPTVRPGQTVRCGNCKKPTTVPPTAGEAPPVQQSRSFEPEPVTQPSELRSYNAPPAYRQSASTSGGSGLAIASLVLGILGFLSCVLFPLGLLGLILGIVSLNKSRAGRGMAITGIIFSAISLLIAPLAAIVFLPAIGAARNTAKQMQNSTQLRGIHQALIIYAQGNNTWYPGIDRDGKITDPSVEARFGMLFNDNHFKGQYAISPSEENQKTPWQSGPVDSSMYSFSMLQVSSHPQRYNEWRQTNNAEAPALSDRLIAEPNGYRSVHTKRANEWRGSIAWNDNHVSFEPDFNVDTKYGRKSTANDNIFSVEGNNDAWMVYTGNGEP